MKRGEGGVMAEKEWISRWGKDDTDMDGARKTE